ncbi:hypothetical protein ACFY04_30435 [Streptomyces sp. NPDC001549]|uniref:hypothetical protein n=1 Tax=Streptomyces sp. NPDC001549 TaxID=3364586 RepID=UPI0036C66C56
MNVRTVDGPEGSGALLALDVLEHAESVPAGPWTVQLGMAAVLDGAGAVWFVEDGQVSRVVLMACTCEHAEVTTYKNGLEICRSVASTS